MLDVCPDYSVPTATPNRSLTCVSLKPNFKILFHPKFRGLGRVGLVRGKDSSPPQIHNRSSPPNLTVNQSPLL